MGNQSSSYIDWQPVHIPNLEIELVYDKVKNSLVMQDLTEFQKPEFLEYFEFGELARGGTIFVQGEPSTHMYFIINGGNVNLIEGHKKKAAKASGGMMFGDIDTILSNARPNTAKVGAGPACRMLRLSKERYFSMVADNKARRTSVAFNIMKNSTLFKFLPWKAVFDAVPFCTEAKFEQGSVVIEHNQIQDKIYIIVRGIAVRQLPGDEDTGFKDIEALAKIGKSSYFGDTGALFGKPNTYRIVADTRLSVLVLDRPMDNLQYWIVQAMKRNVETREVEFKRLHEKVKRCGSTTDISNTFLEDGVTSTYSPSLKIDPSLRSVNTQSQPSIEEDSLLSMLFCYLL